jgi:hypothetical protein
VAPLFFPVPLCLEIPLLGLILLWFTKKQKAGKIIVSIGVGLIIIFSYGTIQDFLLRSLENKYTPLINLQEIDDVKWVVVLGGGHTSDPELPVKARDGLLFPIFKPKVPGNPAVVLVDFTIALSPIVKFAGANAQPFNESSRRYLAVRTPMVDKIDDRIPDVVGNPLLV